jgi:hypothetical protein
MQVYCDWHRDNDCFRLFKAARDLDCDRWNLIDVKITQGQKSVSRSSLTLAGISVVYFLLIALQS